MIKNRLKICVIGGGKWGINHINTLEKLSALGGVVDNDNEVINNVKNNFKKTKIFTSRCSFNGGF